METPFYVLKCEEYVDELTKSNDKRCFDKTKIENSYHGKFFNCNSEGHFWTRDKNMNDVLIRITDFYYRVVVEIPPKNRSGNNLHSRKMFEEIGKSFMKYPNVMGYEIVIYKNFIVNRDMNFIELQLRNSVTANFLKKELENYIHPKWNCRFHVHEYNQSFQLQMITKQDLTFSGWIFIDEDFGDKGIVENDDDKISTASIEMVVPLEKLHQVPEDKIPEIKINPIILAYDLECKSESRLFPKPTNYEDEIMIISVSISKEQGIHENYSFCLYDYDFSKPINAKEVFCFETEYDMLIAFQNFIIEQNPDFIIGYNSDSFDNPYLIQRIYNSGKPIINFSKLKHFQIKTKFKWRKDGSDEDVMRKYLHRDRIDRRKEYLIIPGRMHIDVMIYIQKNYLRFKSYSLNSMSKIFLDEQKDDVNFNDMCNAFLGYHESQEMKQLYYKVVRYGIQDSILTIKLFEKLQIFMGLSMQAHVNSVNIDSLLVDGSSVAVKSMIYRKFRQEKILFQPSKTTKSSKYQGATVLEPESGVYKCVYTLDLDSLYPNIIRSYNICFSTVIRDSFVGKGYYDDDDTVHSIKIGSNVVKFMKEPQGILPKLCEYLIEKRTEVRNRKTNSEIVAQINNSLQLALKLSANSIYGFLGINGDPFGFVDGASSTTAMGRRIIMLIKNRIQKKYGHHIIYGDTDSVMCHTNLEKEEDAYKIAVTVRDDLNDWLKREVGKNLGLKLEKVGTIFLLQKKKYIYHYWDFDKKVFETNKDGSNRYHVTGAESVRRDKCSYQAKIFDYLSDLIMTGKSKEEIYNEIVICIISFMSKWNRPENRELTLADLTINYGITDSYENKASNYMLKILYDRLKDDGINIQIGERIDTVICKIPGESRETKVGEKMFMDTQYRLHIEKGSKIKLDLFSYVYKRFQKLFDKTYCRAFNIDEEQKIDKEIEVDKEIVVKYFIEFSEKVKNKSWKNFLSQYPNWKNNPFEFFELIVGDPFTKNKRKTLKDKTLFEQSLHYHNSWKLSKEKIEIQRKKTENVKELKRPLKYTKELEDMFFNCKEFKTFMFKLKLHCKYIDNKRYYFLPAKMIIRNLELKETLLQEMLTR